MNGVLLTLFTEQTEANKIILPLLVVTDYYFTCYMINEIEQLYKVL